MLNLTLLCRKGVTLRNADVDADADADDSGSGNTCIHTKKPSTSAFASASAKESETVVLGSIDQGELGVAAAAPDETVEHVVHELRHREQRHQQEAPARE